MTRKTKRLVVIYVPVIVTLIVIGGLLTLVLSSGGHVAPIGTALAQADAGAPGVVEGSAGENTGEGAQDEAPVAAPAPQDCGFQDLVGKPLDENVLKDSGKTYRVLPPGAMATQDYSPDRINVETDGQGTVVRVWCG